MGENTEGWAAGSRALMVGEGGDGPTSIGRSSVVACGHWTGPVRDEVGWPGPVRDEADRLRGVSLLARRLGEGISREEAAGRGSGRWNGEDRGR